VSFIVCSSLCLRANNEGIPLTKLLLFLFVVIISCFFGKMISRIGRQQSCVHHHHHHHHPPWANKSFGHELPLFSITFLRVFIGQCLRRVAIDFITWFSTMAADTASVPLAIAATLPTRHCRNVKGFWKLMVL